MSIGVQEWPPVEAQASENLPEIYSDLLGWVRDDSLLNGEGQLEQTPEPSAGQLPVNGVCRAKEVNGNGDSSDTIEVSQPTKEPSANEPLAPKSPTAKENDSAEIVDAVGPDHCSLPPKDIHGPVLSPGSTTSTHTSREKLRQLAAKWKIPSEAVLDAEQPTPDMNGSHSSWSVSAMDQGPTTPPNEGPPAEAAGSDRLSPHIEDLNSSSKLHSHSVAAWVLETQEAPLPNLIVPKANRASAHCPAIDPETGAFLPAIEQPDTRFNHELDLQSEPGWRRSNMTSGMQISRELKARARLAQRLKDRFLVQEEIENSQESEPGFPRAECSIRPTTDDDIAGIAEIMNLERKDACNGAGKSASLIRDWDMVKIFNKCKKEKRPFIVATGGEDDLLDRSKWPAQADLAYQEYVKFRSKDGPKPKATIIGFAFALPRQTAMFEAQDNRTDHSCYATLFVHPSHRQKKIGSALLDRLLMSLSPVHCSLIDFDWKCDEPAEIYEQRALDNAQQYSRVFVEYVDAHDEEKRLLSRKILLEKFGFSQVGHLTCLKSEVHEGKRAWLDLFTWELEAQALEHVR